jgi:Zn-dependent protease
MGAALAALGVYLMIQEPIWAAIARLGAWVNLFNLIPISPLDGGRGFRSLTRRERWLVVATMAVMWFFTGEGLLLILMIAGIVAVAAGTASSTPDPVGLMQFITLVIVLSAMCMIPVPLGMSP